MTTAYLDTAVIRVLVVDDHAMVRAAVSDLLDREGSFAVVGDAPDASATLALLERLHVDVVVLDYRLKDGTGADLCRSIVEHHPDVRVLILTTYVDDAIVNAITAAGASGYLCKDVEPSELVDALHAVAGGGAMWDPKVDKRVRVANVSAREAWAEMLSVRETEVVRLVARGFTNADIAADLGVSTHSIKGYLRRAMIKLGCTTRSQVAAVAAQWGLM